MTEAGHAASDAELLFDRRGALALVTLNRPQALNALTLSMFRDFDARLAVWAEDPAVAAVVVAGAGERAFCAGGDVVAIYDSARGDRKVAAELFRAEYTLNRNLFHFPKPCVALIDGVTMGGGAGLSVHGSHRVATERTLFAMPETGIGLFPDVGSSYFLPRLPGELGLYLGLTGARLKAADCLYAGVATHHVESAKLPALVEALATADWAGDGVAAASGVIAGFASDPGAPPLAGHRAAIDRCFAGASVEEILAALEAEGGDWAEATRATLLTRSPTSLKVTFRQLRAGATLDFDQAMTMEYRLSQACVAGHDLLEGIRAMVIDKDRVPRWRPASLAEVSEAMVDAHFAPLGERDLTFG
jgi:enoyl-CoA hydratase